MVRVGGWGRESASVFVGKLIFVVEYPNDVQ